MFFNGTRPFKILFIFVLVFACYQPLEVFASCGMCYVPPEGSKQHSEESISSGAMINQPTASTLEKNHATAGFTFEHVRYNDIPAANAHELHEQDRDVHGKVHDEIYNAHIGFGIASDVDVYVAAPVVSKTSVQIHDDDVLGRKEHSTGFGDMRLIGKYRFWPARGESATFFGGKKFIEAAALVGLKFPTGKVDNKDKTRAKFEAEQQPGSGSWDGEFGIVLSRNFRQRVSAATSFQYALRGEGAQDRKLGDTFYYNIGTSVAVRRLGQYPNLSFVCELNHRWSLRDHSRDADRVFDSGGTTIFVTPGFHLDIAKHVSAFWGMPVPVYQNMGGEHEETLFAMIAGGTIYV